MKSLTLTQLTAVSAGIVQNVQEFIPDPILGHELIGWQQVLVGYDTVSWTQKGWLYNSYFEEKTPIYEFTPVFARR